MDNLIVTAENISKKFCRDLKRSLWYAVKDLASEMVLRSDGRAELRADEFWALRDVSFELKKGETLGLIGPNGAGKSTLLKLINGLIKPDAGRISVRGRVGALIELGTGFNPVLTGLENIHVNGAILGLTRREVEQHLQQIIDFADIGDFLHAPVQSYSSGMKVRLGFSIAAHLNPDLLLIDEILSVGDSSFRQRCLERLSDYKRTGGAIILVSHNSVAVEAISDRVLFLENGRVADIGQPAETIMKYEARALDLSHAAGLRLHGRGPVAEQNDITITAVEYYDLKGQRRDEFQFGESFEVRLHFQARQEIWSPYFAVAIQKSGLQDSFVSIAAMLWDGIELKSIAQKGTVGCIIRNPSFSPGMYHLSVGVQSQVSGLFGKKWYMPYSKLGSFTVVPGPLRDRLPGAPSAYLVSLIPPMVVDHSWHLNGALLSGVPSGPKERCHS